MPVLRLSDRKRRHMWKTTDRGIMEELVNLLEKTILDHQGENLVEIDLRTVNPFTDYFLIATAKNLRHASSLADYLIEEAEKKAYTVRLKEGSEGSDWILVDFKDVIVHIFTEDARMRYRLETLWGDLPFRKIEE